MTRVGDLLASHAILLAARIVARTEGIRPEAKREVVLALEARAHRMDPDGDWTEFARLVQEVDASEAKVC